MKPLPIISTKKYSKLLANTKKSGDCLLWLGSSNQKGYGTTQYQLHRYLVTRLVLRFISGNDGSGLMACHTCDNPACINLDHLFWGTQSENIGYMVKKGETCWPEQEHGENSLS